MQHALRLSAKLRQVTTQSDFSRDNMAGPDQRRLPVGAEVQPDGGVHFRVWAPKRMRVEVVLLSGPGAHQENSPAAVELNREEHGYFSALVPQAAAGTIYSFRLDNQQQLFPDPVSRFQPEGPHGPSQVVDPSRFQWTDAGWKGLPVHGQVLYEMHIGTFTQEGTFAAASQQLVELARLGITTVEVMPVGEFPGRFGWGYDGVDLFAPTRLYGTPDDFRRFVDRAHSVGLAVILDVVYNHFGPSGNYLRAFADEYFTDRHKVEWGEAINFDGLRSGPVREFFISNAEYWIDEFHLDGLRLDATQAIFDTSPEHVLAAINQKVRHIAGERQTLIVSENERQEVIQVESLEKGGYGLDALWNDDFHHAATVAMTGRNEFYYSDYLGTPQELIAAVKWGYLFQGQWYGEQARHRGSSSLHVDAPAFVIFLQNHDQIANSARGHRVHQITTAGRYRAMTALMLLAPGTPMLFQGQEFAATTPFCYFADHEFDLSRLVQQGRLEFLRRFKSIACAETYEHLADPADYRTFEKCKLDFSERERNQAVYDMHRDLLSLRRRDPVFAAQRADRIHGAVISTEALLLRYLGESGDDRLLLMNLGRDYQWLPSPEPLLAPPAGKQWKLLWSSEHPRYGGSGTPCVDFDGDLRLPGHATLVFTAVTTGQTALPSPDEAL